MTQCQQCGNECDKASQVVMDGQSYVFDSFECAVAKLAPTCKHILIASAINLVRFAAWQAGVP